VKSSLDFKDLSDCKNNQKLLSPRAINENVSSLISILGFVNPVHLLDDFKKLYALF
jgi:hypothetical protein